MILATSLLLFFWLQISGVGRKENQFFCISKPSFRFVHRVGLKRLEAKSSKPFGASWLLLGAWTVLASV
jgi:hypothetical protein